MPTSIDRNDVDISKLFSWGAKFPIYGENKEVKLEVNIRLVGDADLNRARVFALRKSAELRKKLKNPESDENLAFLPDIDFIEKEEITKTLLLFLTRDYSTEALKNVKVTLKKEPDSDASLEEQEEYQQFVDSYPELRNIEIRKYLEEKLKDKEEELNSRDKEDLFKELIRYLIDSLCENEMMLKFKEMCTVLGTFIDNEFKQPLFKDFDEFDNLSKVIKDQIIESYLSLEIGGEDLKKLLEVTQ